MLEAAEAVELAPAREELEQPPLVLGGGQHSRTASRAHTLASQRAMLDAQNKAASADGASSPTRPSSSLAAGGGQRPADGKRVGERACLCEPSL